MFAKKIMLLIPLLMLTAFSPSFAQVQWALDTVIAVGAKPTGIAITSDGSKLVVTNDADTGRVKIISTSNLAVSNIDISSIENYPNAVVVGHHDSTALVCTTHDIILIDLTNNSVKGHFAAPCAGTTLYGLAVTPDGSNAIFPDLSSGCTQQGIRLIDASVQTSGSTFIPVSTSGELYGIAITPDSTSALVSTFTSDSPKKVNLSTSAVQNIAGISGSYGLAVLHHSNEALVFDGDSLDLVSLTSNSVIKKISGLSYNTSFQNIAITADDQFAFVVGEFEKLIISLAGDSVYQTFTAGGTNVATAPDGSRFYVTDSYNGDVRVYKKQNIVGVRNNGNVIPLSYGLLQNYPNPFNPSTVIRYQLAGGSHVTLTVYNVLGEEVATLVNEIEGSGNYTVTLDGFKLPSGVYFYRLKAGPFTQIKKMLLMK